MGTTIKRAYRDELPTNMVNNIRDSVKKKRSIREDPKSIINNSLVETFNIVLDDVENQNKYILTKLYERDKTVNRLIQSTIVASANTSLIDQLAVRIFEAENESQFILHKLEETERRIKFLTTTTTGTATGEHTLMDELKTTLLDIQLRNNLMRKQIYHTEPKMRNLEQYSRKENIEIIGIPENVSNRDLETTVIKLLGSINIPVTSCDIVTCHRLPKQGGEACGKVIVRFVDKQVSMDVLCNRDQLKRSIYKHVFKNDISIGENLTIL